MNSAGANASTMAAMHDRQDTIANQYGQVCSLCLFNEPQSDHLLCLQHLHNSYPQSNYLGSNQRLSACPPNGSLNQCTSLNGAMPNAINGSMHSIQCSSIHHSHPGNGMPNNMAQDINSMCLTKSNANMPMNASGNAMYGATNVPNSRARGSSGYSTNNQQQFMMSQKRQTHQYPINNVNIPFNNTSSAPISSSYGSQSQAHFNSNQVGLSVIRK